MKKLFTPFLVLLMAYGCQQEAFIEELGADPGGDVSISVDPTDQEIFDGVTSQDPRPGLDNSTQGIYHGVIGSYDLKIHGEIVVNVGNDGNYAAAIHLDNDDKFILKANNRQIDNLRFSGLRGSFVINVTDIEMPMATEVVIDQSPGYMVLYKETSNRSISIALGTYQDRLEPEFKGHWDLISLGIPEFNFPGAIRVEDLIISNGDSIFKDLAPNSFEPFDGCFGLSVRGAYMAQLSENLKILEGKDQKSIINGQECNWTLSVSQDLDNFEYLDERCDVNPFAKGFWDWNGRTGTLTINALRYN